MFKQNLQQQQQSSSGSSNGQMGDSELARYDVYELANEDDSMQNKLLLKLTDECTAAIKNAIKLKSKILMNVVDGMATIEVQDSDGNPLKFKCSLQNQPATDVVFYQKGKMYKNIGLTSTVKLQVQATDKTFAEMKEKTQKLVEAEQQKKAKDMPKMPKNVKNHKHSQHSGKSSTLTAANIISKISSSNASKRSHQSPLQPTNMPLKKQKHDIEMPKSKAIIDMPENSMILKKMEEDEKKKTNSAKAITDANKQYSKKKPSTVKKDLFNIPKHKHLQRAPSISPASTELSTPKTISPPTMTCPPSMDNNIQMNEDMAHVDQDEQIPPLSSLTLVIEPSCDWRLQFGKITNKDQAIRYYDCFKFEYPEYHQCYEIMEKVAEEFRKLQKELKKAKNEAERLKIEEEVRKKFAMYQNDKEFLRNRQKHHDLRMKLDVIKQALHEWSKQQQ